VTLLGFGTYKVKTVRRIYREISQSVTVLIFVRYFGTGKLNLKTLITKALQERQMGELILSPS